MIFLFKNELFCLKKDINIFRQKKRELKLLFLFFNAFVIFPDNNLTFQNGQLKVC